MKITEYAIKNSVTSWMFALILLVGGLVAYNDLGRLEDPQFTLKMAMVTTVYPGASPVQVEEEVSYPLENAIQQLPYVKFVKSISSAGFSQIVVEMKSNYRKDDLKQIETYVKNDILIIKQKKTSWLGSWGNNSGKITINVPVESIDKVVLSGSGSINARHQLTSRNFDVMLSGSGKINLNLVTDNFEGTLTGSGNIKLQGKATNAAYQLTGSGDFEAKFFETTNGLAKITGSGDIEMNASSKINAQITGSGDIICHGNPDIQKTNTTGSGDVKIIN